MNFKRTVLGTAAVFVIVASIAWNMRRDTAHGPNDVAPASAESRHAAHASDRSVMESALGTEGRTAATAPESVVEPVACDLPGSTSSEPDDIRRELLARDLAGEKWNGPWVKFDKAEQCARDPRFNPAGIEIGPARLEELRSLISRVNAHLLEAQGQIDFVAKSHIQDKINAGHAQLVMAGDRPDWKALGEAGLPMSCSADGKTYYLKILEGEFSDLDHAMYVNSALAKIGEERIAAFFR